MTFYNEHDSFAAAWLERLVGGGHIASGRVDARGIEPGNCRDKGDVAFLVPYERSTPRA